MESFSAEGGGPPSDRGEGQSRGLLPPPIKIRRYFYASSPLPFHADRLASAGDEEMLGVYMEVEAMAEVVRKSISE